MKHSRLVLCLSAIICIAMSRSFTEAAIIIDNFSTDQSASVSGGPFGFKSAFSSLADPTVIGGEREIYVERTSNNGGTISADSGGAPLSLASYSSGPSTMGNALFTWDGVDGVSGINFTGLGGIDLTEGGTGTAFIGKSVSDQGTTATFTVYSDAFNFSQATFAVPADPSFTLVDFTILFSNFTVAGGSGANFTNVGAITMFIDGQTSALDAAVDFVQTNGTPVPTPPSLVMGLVCLALVALNKRRLAIA